MSPLHFHNFYHYKAIILTKENNTIYQKSFIPEFLTTNTFIIILRERFAFSAVNTRIICTTSFDEGTFLNIRSLQNIFKVRKISKTMFLDFNSSKKLTEMFSLILTQSLKWVNSKRMKAHYLAIYGQLQSSKYKNLIYTFFICILLTSSNNQIYEFRIPNIYN